MEIHGEISMEIDVLILHGIPWRILHGFFHVFSHGLFNVLRRKLELKSVALGFKSVALCFISSFCEIVNTITSLDPIHSYSLFFLFFLYMYIDSEKPYWEN